MKQHFITINALATKNKAHAEIQKFAMEYDNCLIDQHRLIGLIDKIYGEAAYISAKNPRCEKLQIVHNSFTPGSQSLVVEGNFRLIITEVKRFELSNQKGATE